MGKTPTKLQVSAGGVVFRKHNEQVQVALISVGQEERWQLPKGLVKQNESNESAAIREVREETGLDTDLIALIDKIEYWYFSKNRGQGVRFHKFVYFYLLRYKSGKVENHDQEVNEARWLAINQAHQMLAFETEQRMVEQAKEMIASIQNEPAAHH